MMLITQKNDQTLADMVVQAVGNIDALIGLCVENDLSISDEEEREIVVNAEVDNKKVVELLSINRPATAVGEIPEGVSVWRTGLDFKIS